MYRPTVYNLSFSRKFIHLIVEIGPFYTHHSQPANSPFMQMSRAEWYLGSHR